MSGIAGILDLKGAPVAQGLVEMMTSGMAYRGLDGSAHWRGSAAALGHCQFRTTRESLEETQPLATTDGSVVLVLDGRVDNYAELRRELVGCGARLRSVADAELVLHAYETWGTASLGRIDGDFALVIWDTRKREVFCARDRLGIRSLHYSWDGSRFVFASDLHAILALPGFAKRLNEGMLAEFLAAEFHSCDETLWDGVLRLEAGH
jgi:asparagine synthase (glutamine-hydrolysing)